MPPNNMMMGMQVPPVGIPPMGMPQTNVQPMGMPQYNMQPVGMPQNNMQLMGMPQVKKSDGYDSEQHAALADGYATGRWAYHQRARFSRWACSNKQA